MANGKTRILLSVSAVLFVLAFGNPVVKIHEGVLSGTWATTRYGRKIASFRGIPYAKPPIGELRFAHPVPAGSWDGILKADKDASQCMQVDEDSVVRGSEDCLYLNVYTPQLRENSTGKDNSFLLPVMVYIHGGAFIKLNASSIVTGPKYLLDKDIILVTLNYRLGMFGFFSTGDDVAPGNFGLKDQVLALQWVQKNIHSFGGDPEKVTLFGESAGAVCVHLHALSDVSKGLFRYYIMQSGNALMPWGFRAHDEYLTIISAVTFSLGCHNSNTTEMIQCLRESKAEDLINANSAFNVIANFARITWGPTVEVPGPNSFITKIPALLILENKMKDSPFISGVVKDEGLLMTGSLYVNTLFYEFMMHTLRISLTSIMAFFGESSLWDTYKFAGQVEDFYFGEEVTNDQQLFAKQFTNFLSDGFFFYGTVQMLLNLKQRMESPFYFYSFEYRGTLSYSAYDLKNDTNVGVAHQDDNIYLFEIPPVEVLMPYACMNKRDYEMTDLMVDLWTTFAITGAPTKDPDFWKPYSQNNCYLRIGNGCHATTALKRCFRSRRMHFWFQNAEAFPFEMNDKLT